ncbi:MAG: hypothetical protein ABSH50_12600 [Bryobacteraceae bacterium]|jgi:hypothetical protein
MKKTLLAITLAAATLPLTFAAQTPAPATQPDQKSTATTKKTTKSAKHSSKKTSATKSTTSPAPKN